MVPWKDLVKRHFPLSETFVRSRVVQKFRLVFGDSLLTSCLMCLSYTQVSMHIIFALQGGFISNSDLCVCGWRHFFCSAVVPREVNSRLPGPSDTAAVSLLTQQLLAENGVSGEDGGDMDVKVFSDVCLSSWAQSLPVCSILGERRGGLRETVLYVFQSAFLLC